MTDRVGLAGMGSRRIGAIAGLAPALMVVVLLVIFGYAAPTREVILPLVGIIVAAVVIGWLVGPLATGSFRADGCGSAEFTVQGMGASAVLAIGAIAFAATAASAGLKADAA